jgi:hypothetical protein
VGRRGGVGFEYFDPTLGTPDERVTGGVAVLVVFREGTDPVGTVVKNPDAIATLDPGTLVDVISADPNVDSDVSDQDDSSDDADKSIIEYEGDKPDALTDADTPGADSDDTASGRQHSVRCCRSGWNRHRRKSV